MEDLYEDDDYYSPHPDGKDPDRIPIIEEYTEPGRNTPLREIGQDLFENKLAATHDHIEALARDMGRELSGGKWQKIR